MKKVVKLHVKYSKQSNAMTSKLRIKLKTMYSLFEPVLSGVKFRLFGQQDVMAAVSNDYLFL